jgi:hypothetical protein
MDSKKDVSVKIIVTIMIKNEEKIIKRCIENCLCIADAICISDTGSTDNTVNILNEYTPTLNIPTKLSQHTWKDFGHNRSKSFIEAQLFCKTLKWDPDKTYSLLLDADMKFVMTKDFDKNSLSVNGYIIKQKNPVIEYYNTRFIKIGFPWKCIGVTHEYWAGTGCEKLDTIYIDDIGDGGCKDDKFIRDEKLLRKGLEDEPDNYRYMFYLAQTLKDVGKTTESIEMYKKRIEAGGWYEEVWFSMYTISKLYFSLGNLTEMEYWGMKAYDFNKNRSENIYFLTKIFREKAHHYKAWHYLQIGIKIPLPKEMLFVETQVYQHLFLYEKNILNYYVNYLDKNNNLIEMVNYYNNFEQNLYNNFQFYVQQISLKSNRILDFKEIGDYIPSSTSILKQYNNYVLNVRYVNYRIQPDGSYHAMNNGILKDNNTVKTRQFTLLVDSDFKSLTELTEILPDFEKTYNSRVQDIEDLRLYKYNNKIKWIGMSTDYSHDGKIRQVIGDYDFESKKLKNHVSIESPENSDCEKNWIPLGNEDFIYKWHPYTVGKIENNKFIKTLEQDTPKIFERFRGSSNIVEYNSYLWTITHMVLYTKPRKYYHQLMKLNKETKKVESYSLPFYFKRNHIEYCLGIEIKNDILYAIFSENDSNPSLVEIILSDFIFTNL